MEGTAVLGRVTWRAAKVVVVYDEASTVLSRFELSRSAQMAGEPLSKRNR